MDIVLAVVLSVAAVTEILLQAGGFGVTSTALAVVLTLGTTAPLALGRPLLAGVVVCSVAALMLTPFGGLTAAGTIGTVLAVHRAGRAGLAASPVLVVPFVSDALVDTILTEPTFTGVLLAAATPAAAWSGLADHARDQLRTQSAAREVIAGSLVEHTARGERARIARELHDVVAHHISMVAVQAESTRITTPGLPVAAAQRLVEIRDTARGGLTEMRRLLGVLREDAEADLPERHPQPGLAQLHDLLDEARSVSGATTRLIVSGAPVAPDPGVELAAYRIVQEALTNSRRHAPGAAVDVELRYADDALHVRVRDNGPGPAAAVGEEGHGLQGMRERAVAVGGVLRAGPAVLGGFLVEATLPAKTDAAR